MSYVNSISPADNIRETTNSTGIGDVILPNVGAAGGFSAWSTWYSNGTKVVYCINDSNGNWEVGFGTFITGNKITRDAVYWSSNAGAVVDFTGLTASVFAGPHSGTTGLGCQLHAVQSSAAPNSTNNQDFGWDYGSFWFKHPLWGSEIYVCVDPQPGGGAVWTQLLTAMHKIVQPATMTTGGTTGAQTIDKPSGSVNFAASATSLVVTNSLVSASSIILATVMTNDSTLKSVQAVAGSGTFTLYANAAATAETKVAFLVIN